MIQKHENLILIIDDEIAISSLIAQFLTVKGYSTITASDGAEALALFKDKKPSCVITDLQMPVLKGLDFLKNVRTFDSTTPVIVVTGFPDLDTAVEAIHLGAYDYVIKPFKMEVLYSKILQALNTVNLTNENVALSKLVSLHDITNKLSNSHSVGDILDLMFGFCCNSFSIDIGSILLINREEDALEVVRKKGEQPGPVVSRIDNSREWPLAKWVLTNAKTLVVNSGVSNPATEKMFGLGGGAHVSVPIKANEKVIGVLNLRRDARIPFTEADVNILEVLTTQAGTAINNANLYASLKQKISELSLISTYSEHFVGLVDLNEVIKCLFQTVRQYFTIDVLGFFVVKKRYHDFLYWTRGVLSDEWIEQIIEQTVKAYNYATTSTISQKRVRPKAVEIIARPNGKLTPPLAFNHTIPLMWEDFKFGALYFGAEKVPEHAEEKISLLTSLVSQTRIALTSAMLYNQMQENYIRTIKALAIAVDAKDTYTHGHSENVMNIAEAIAEEMRVDGKNIGIIRDGGLLHDIGKIGIPGYILNKPGPLTREEFDGVMKSHSTLGANIVKGVPFLKDLHSLILHHHEHHDGTGYPDGLKGDEIPLGARILHVADAFEAMTSNRPYRDSLGKKEALRRLTENKGKEFDPQVVDAFMRMAEKKGWFESD